MEKSKKKIIIASLLVSFFFNFLYTKVASAATRLICNEIYKNKSPKAILLGPSGEVAKNFSLGEIQIEKNPGDFIFSKNNFDLILFPASLIFEERCGMGACIEGKKIKSKCPNTSEYILSIGVSPKNSLGKLESGITLRIVDTNSDFGDEANVNLQFQTKIYGYIKQ